MHQTLQGAPVENWYVLCIHAGRDGAIAERVEDAGFKVFSPEGKKIVIHKRYKTRLPKTFRLLPGYLFVAGENFAPTLAVDGVYGFLGTEDAPSRVPLGYVESLQREEMLGAFDTSKRPNKGDKVQVEIFGESAIATVTRTTKDRIEAVADFMGKLVTLVDCTNMVRLEA